MILWPHNWVDDKIIYLTAAEIEAARIDDAACTARKAAELARPKPLTLEERLAALEGKR